MRNGCQIWWKVPVTPTGVGAAILKELNGVSNTHSAWCTSNQRLLVTRDCSCNQQYKCYFWWGGDLCSFKEFTGPEVLGVVLEAGGMDHKRCKVIEVAKKVLNIHAEHNFTMPTIITHKLCQPLWFYSQLSIVCSSSTKLWERCQRHNKGCREDLLD